MAPIDRFSYPLQRIDSILFHPIVSNVLPTLYAFHIVLRRDSNPMIMYRLNRFIYSPLSDSCDSWYGSLV